NSMSNPSAYCLAADVNELVVITYPPFASAFLMFERISAIGSNGISSRKHLTCPKNKPSFVRCSKSTPKSSVDGETQVEPPRPSLNKSATKCSNIKGSSFIRFEEYVG